MRKPNGYGSIKKLSGNRRRPFVFVISVEGKQKPVQYFTMQVEAEIFQVVDGGSNGACWGITTMFPLVLNDKMHDGTIQSHWSCYYIALCN